MRLTASDDLPMNLAEKAAQEIAELVQLAGTAKAIKADEVIYQTARNRAAAANEHLKASNLKVQTVRRAGGVWYIVKPLS